MARAKKVSKAADDEHMELEAAMSELSRQTDALLAEAKPKKQVKPTLPQKKIIPHSKGASLDIVGHAPSSIHRSTKISKATRPELKEELLPEHAGLSFNEKPADAKVVQNEVKPAVESHQYIKSRPKVIINQQPRVVDSAIPVGSERVSVVDADSGSNEAVAVNHETKSYPELANDLVDKDTTAKADPVDPTDEVISTSNVKPELKPTTQLEPIVDMKSSVEEPKETEIEESLTDKNTDEDGIVKLEDEPKEKADVFDVEEYQAELHDWSKLASNSHWPVIVLVFLLLLAGGIMYLYFTNNLPKIL